jgi:type 1 glutamine amidotransferase
MFNHSKTFLSCACAIILSACAPQTTDDVAEDVVHYDHIRPAITQWMQQPAILVFSKTQEWRHNEGIAGADAFFAQLSRDEGYGLFTTVNSAVFNAEDLSRFDVIVFNNMTGDALSPDQENAFRTWLEDGGAWIGIHGSGDSSHSDWDWYRNSLIGPTFIGHPMKPQFNVGDIVTLNPTHPIMKGIPDRWSHDEEWYSFDSRPQDYGLTPLTGLDETSIWPDGSDYVEDVELRMGTTPIEHPVMWTGCIENGRIFYSALGHSDKAYANPTNRTILKNSFQWVQKKSDPNGEHCPVAAEQAK